MADRCNWLRAVLVLTVYACSTDRKPADLAVEAIAAATPARATLRLIVIGNLEGMLEPCGCTSRPAGGIDRLATGVAQARGDALPTLTLLTGNTFFDERATSSGRPQRQQDAWQAEVLTAALTYIGIDVAAPGPADLARGQALLARFAREASVAVIGPTTAGAFDSSTLRKVGGIQIGISAVGSDAAESISSSVRDVAREITLLRKRGAQLVIAVVHTTDARHARQIAEQTAADIVIYSARNQHALPAVVAGAGTLLLQPGRPGEGFLDLELWPVTPGPAAWELRAPVSVPTTPIDTTTNTAIARYRVLDKEMPADPKVRALLTQLYARIHAHNSQHAATPAKPVRGQASYIGSDTCAACHTQAYLGWRESQHGRAFQTLVARGRQLDLDCIGCHVTGYDRPGGASVAKLEHLQGVGCESCHGPGSMHADNPRPPHRIMRRVVPEQICIECHDTEHSDGFRYASARDALLVPGHGR